MDHLRNGSPLKYEWKMPEWIYEHKDFILANLMDDNIVNEYQIYHDCGKPYCRTVDADGRVHFPDHAKVSKQTWLDHGGSEQIARLIGMDMDVHVMKADDIPEFVQRPEAITLLITALCEIHSNCAMFGGIESTSFKIKWKHTNKRGKAIIKTMVE